MKTLTRLLVLAVCFANPFPISGEANADETSGANPVGRVVEFYMDVVHCYCKQDRKNGIKLNSSKLEKSLTATRQGMAIHACGERGELSRGSEAGLPVNLRQMGGYRSHGGATQLSNLLERVAVSQHVIGWVGKQSFELERRHRTSLSQQSKPRPQARCFKRSRTIGVKSPDGQPTISHM